MTILKRLASLNRHQTDRFIVQVGSFSVGAPNLDRLVYLWLHRLQLLGKRDLDFLSQTISPGMNVVDVGANIGLYSLFFSRLVGPSGTLLALEPHPALASQLKSNLDRNQFSHVEVLSVAAGAKHGRHALSLHPLNSGDNRLIPGVPGGTSDIIDVNVVSIDSLLGGRKVDLVKIDVQGWEPLVIQGMSESLARNPAMKLFFEYSPSDLRKAGYSPIDFLEELISRKFLLIDPRKKGFIGLREVRSLSQRHDYFNLFATRHQGMMA